MSHTSEQQPELKPRSRHLAVLDMFGMIIFLAIALYSCNVSVPELAITVSLRQVCTLSLNLCCVELFSVSQPRGSPTSQFFGASVEASILRCLVLGS